MQIDVIEDIEVFKSLKHRYHAVYEADPQSHFFLSWTWLLGLFQYSIDQVFILAAKPDVKSDYVAFFPLKLSIEYHEKSGLSNSLYVAGSGVADYSGIVALPEFVHRAVPAYAQYLKKQEYWSLFQLPGLIAPNPRTQLFLSLFEENDYRLKELTIQNDDENFVDNSICPYIPLSNYQNWDNYLQNALSSNTRQKVRRFLRKVEGDDEFCIAHADSDNIDHYIDIILNFWEIRWAKRKGPNTPGIIAALRRFLGHSFEHGCLYFPMLWRGATPLGGVAIFVDKIKKAFLFYVTGRDKTVTKLPIGLILHAYSIREAYNQGFETYDFLRGNEPYKYSFGVQERHIKYIAIQANNFRHQDERLDPQTIPQALKLTIQQHQTGHLVEAERGYAQILAVRPEHPVALYRLALLKQHKGDNQAAEDCFQTLLKYCPDSPEAWFKLGNLYQSEERFEAAITAYERVLELKPNAIPAYNNMGYSLQQKGDLNAAIACYQKGLEIQPNCIELEANLANARHSQGQLSWGEKVYYASINRTLGLKCQQTGDLNNAIAHYQQAINMNPESNCQYLISKIDELKNSLVL